VGDLHRLSAADVARLVGRGELTAEAVVRDCLERIREREADVQAWAHCDPAAAIAQARAADARGERGPLAGVPVAVKDVIDVSGMPTQCNSPIYAGYRPQADAACVALVRGAGGIILGKSVTTEFASRVPGPTRNPHDLGHTPGGSSSGSAAAVADFMAPLAFGTQTGGSTIRPAAYCGIVGYKPSFGAINCSGLKHFAESLDTIGVMGRTVEDCALLANAAAGRPAPDFRGPPVHPPRIGFCRTSRWAEASAATHALLEETAGTLSRRGAHVSPLALPGDFDALYEEQVLIMNYEAARALAWERQQHERLLSEHLRTTLRRYADMPCRAYSAAMRHARTSRLALAAMMADVDVLLTPSAPDEAPHGIGATGSSVFNRNWTLLGLPCVTLPAGRGPCELPLGVQIVGDYANDARVLECAEWVRHALH